MPQACRRGFRYVHSTAVGDFAGVLFVGAFVALAHLINFGTWRRIKRAGCGWLDWHDRFYILITVTIPWAVWLIVGDSDGCGRPFDLSWKD